MHHAKPTAEDFRLIPVSELLALPLPTRAQEAAELARDAARYLDGGHYENAAWRLADALALIAKKCAPGAAGIGTYTGRGARLDLDPSKGFCAAGAKVPGGGVKIIQRSDRRKPRPVRTQRFFSLVGEST